MDPRPNPAQAIIAPPQCSIHELVERQAKCTPAATAMTDLTQEISYAAMQRAIDGVARRLADLGVRKGDRVGIWADRTVNLPVAILGTLASGGVFVIFDPKLPPQRHTQMLALSSPQAMIILATAPNMPLELKTSLSTVASFILGPDLDDRPIEAPRIALSGDDLAYIAFTSGTTAQPKGIMGWHAPVTHFLHWHTEKFQFGEGDRFAMISGLAHDPLLRDILTPLVSGGTLVVPPREAIRDPQILRALLVEEAVTVMHLTPSLGQLLSYGRQQAVAYRVIPKLRLAFFGGEPLKYSLVSQFHELAPNAAIVNFYGATETPQAMGFWKVEPDHAFRLGHVPVGYGIDDVQLLVVDTDGHLAAIGEVGEICIRSPFLAKGYLGQIELTEERFIANHFSIQVNDRIYRTGDMGCYRADGAVELLGRSDRQVKIRGFRVELDEIEAFLSTHPQVRHAAIGMHNGEVIGYFAVDPGVDEANLRRFARETLPDYMIPTSFILLDSLPLTPNGKVDRHALPPVTYRRVETSNSIPGRDALETRLADLWSEVLRIPSIGRDDRFFALGGDSMKGLQLLLRVEESFGRALPVHSLLQADSVGRMAELLRQDQTNIKNKLLVSIRESGTKNPVYWLPGGGGLSVMAFRAVSCRLGVDRPVYGLEADLDPKRAPHDLREIVAAYKREILAHQSHGPYHLFGFSLGSFVAYELAVQLRADGYQVGLLVVFDTAVAVMLSSFERCLLSYYRWRSHIRGLQSSVLKKHISRWRKTPPSPRPMPNTNFDLICRRNIRAVHNYAAKPLPSYDGKVTCVLARNSWMHGIPVSIDPRLAWGKAARGGVESHVVAGDHLSMLEEPEVDELSSTLRAILRRFEML